MVKEQNIHFIKVNTYYNTRKQNSRFFSHKTGVFYVSPLLETFFTNKFVCWQERSMLALTQYLWKQILQAAHFTKSPTQSGRRHLQWRFIGVYLCLVLLRFLIFGCLSIKTDIRVQNTFYAKLCQMRYCKKTTVYIICLFFAYQLKWQVLVGIFAIH